MLFKNKFEMFLNICFIKYYKYKIIFFTTDKSKALPILPTKGKIPNCHLKFDVFGLRPSYMRPCPHDVETND